MLKQALGNSEIRILSYIFKNFITDEFESAMMKQSLRQKIYFGLYLLHSLLIMLVGLWRLGVNLLKIVRVLWDRRKIYYISLFLDINFPKAASFRL